MPAEYRWQDTWVAEPLTSHEVEKKPRPRILSCGLGVDSTAMLLLLTQPERAKEWLQNQSRDVSALARFTRIDAVFFADPGSEHLSSYDLLRHQIKPYCESYGLPLFRIRAWSPTYGLRTLQQEKLDSGTIPFMPQSRHTCSVKYKVNPQKWAADYLFGGVETGPNARLTEPGPGGRSRIAQLRMMPGYRTTFYVGFNADESGRRIRAGSYAVSAVADPYHRSVFPNLELGLTRADEQEILRQFAPDWPEISKSACLFCPFMSLDELVAMMVHHPEEWAQVKQLEDRFRQVSPEAFASGRWSRDSWAEGARLLWPLEKKLGQPTSARELEQIVIEHARTVLKSRSENRPDMDHVCE